MVKSKEHSDGTTLDWHSSNLTKHNLNVPERGLALDEFFDFLGTKLGEVFNVRGEASLYEVWPGFDESRQMQRSVLVVPGLP